MSDNIGGRKISRPSNAARTTGGPSRPRGLNDPSCPEEEEIDEGLESVLVSFRREGLSFRLETIEGVKD